MKQMQALIDHTQEQLDLVFTGSKSQNGFNIETDMAVLESCIGDDMELVRPGDIQVQYDFVEDDLSDAERSVLDAIIQSFWRQANT